MQYTFRYKDGFEKKCSAKEAEILEKLKRGAIVRDVPKHVAAPEEKPRKRKTAPAELE